MIQEASMEKQSRKEERGSIQNYEGKQPNVL